jgi:hypothetical protein
MFNAVLPILLSGFAIAPKLAISETTLIDLDTASGAYSVWRQSGLTSRSVSFVSTFANTRIDKKWAPRYTIHLEDSDRNSITFSVTFPPGYPPMAEAALSSSGNKTILTPEPNLAMPVGDPCTVQLEWGDGSVKLTVDGKVQEYKVGFTPTQIELSASTGELEVKNITFGK